MNIGYTTYTGDILRGGYEDIVIDSINNTFDIYIKFESESDESDVSKINNELYFYDNESGAYSLRRCATARPMMRMEFSSSPTYTRGSYAGFSGCSMSLFFSL